MYERQAKTNQSIKQQLKHTQKEKRAKHIGLSERNCEEKCKQKQKQKRKKNFVGGRWVDVYLSYTNV